MLKLVTENEILVRKSNEHYVDLYEYLENFGNFARFPTKINNFTKKLKKDMKSLLGENLRSQKYLVSDFDLYNSNIETLEIYQTKPLYYEPIIFSLIISYLSILFIVVEYLGSMSFIKTRKNTKIN